MEEKEHKIDFTPIMREAQEYAKLMSDIVEKQEMSEDEYTAVMGHRVSLADSFCFLIFGKKFDDIRKKYIEFVGKNIESLDSDMDGLKKELQTQIESEIKKRLSEK